MQLKTDECFFVFDLDDTLYPESAYQASGIAAVCTHLREVYGKDISEKLTERRESKADVLAYACELVGLPPAAKETLLWIYRLHVPAIKLEPAIRSLVGELERNSRGVSILTDGRSATQRFKLKALGLERLPVYISEEWGASKPDLKRFKKIMLEHAAESYVYVGDNPQKDFVGPNSLGWVTIGVRGNATNIHSQDCSRLDLSFHPMVWLEEINRLSEILC